jgi:hypothetical protein
MPDEQPATFKALFISMLSGRLGRALVIVVVLVGIAEGTIQLASQIVSFGKLQDEREITRVNRIGATCDVYSGVQIPGCDYPARPKLSPEETERLARRREEEQQAKAKQQAERKAAVIEQINRSPVIKIGSTCYHSLFTETGTETRNYTSLDPSSREWDPHYSKHFDPTEYMVKAECPPDVTVYVAPGFVDLRQVKK